MKKLSVLILLVTSSAVFSAPVDWLGRDLDYHERITLQPRPHTKGRHVEKDVVFLEDRCLGESSARFRNAVRTSFSKKWKAEKFIGLHINSYRSHIQQRINSLRANEHKYIPLSDRNINGVNLGYGINCRIAGYAQGISNLTSAGQNQITDYRYLDFVPWWQFTKLKTIIYRNPGAKNRYLADWYLLTSFVDGVSQSIYSAGVRSTDARDVVFRPRNSKYINLR